MEPLDIDGGEGEGGGQILRTSLAMSIVTGRPVRIRRIRAGRKTPGLAPQHLASVRAAAVVGNAEVEGDELRSQRIDFRPRGIVPGEHWFRIGTAGATGLVLQTVLPPLLRADLGSRLHVEGGTHVPHAPPFDYLAGSFLPVVERFGPRLHGALERAGFYPKGGGRVVLDVEPAGLSPMSLLERGEVRRIRATVLLARLPDHIARREHAILADRLGIRSEDQATRAIEAASPGNVAIVEVDCAGLTAVFTAVGERGTSAESVARALAAEVEAWLAADVPVDQHLADQLLIPLALAGGGAFRTVEPTLHTTTNVAVIERFLPVRFQVEREDERAWRIALEAA